MHHVSIRTADIFRSIEFYQCLGFTVTERFTTGYTLACWLQSDHSRLELIQIPQPKPAPEAFNDEHYVGYYHICFDLTETALNLNTWITELTLKLQAAQQPIPTVLLPPAQQIIGTNLYEVTFIADPDNLPLEFIRRLN